MYHPYLIIEFIFLWKDLLIIRLLWVSEVEASVCSCYAEFCGYYISCLVLSVSALFKWNDFHASKPTCYMQMSLNCSLQTEATFSSVLRSKEGYTTFDFSKKKKKIQHSLSVNIVGVQVEMCILWIPIYSMKYIY